MRALAWMALLAGTTIIQLTPTAAPAAPAGSGVHTPRITYQDSIDRLIDYLGATVNPEAVRESRRATLAAYREFPTRHHWTYLLTHGRLFINGQYATGTVQYLHSSGTYARQLTLTGGTWPSWALFGTIRIGTVTFDIAQVINSTVLQLDAVLGPGPQGDANIPSGTPYTIYRDTYTLPADFSSGDRGFAEISWGSMEYVPAASWLRVTRYYLSSSNSPRWYTFRGDPRNPGLLVWSIFPFPDVDRTIDYLYSRTPRVLNIANYSTGTAGVNFGAAATTITGSGTAWTSAMVGSVVRLSGNTLAPTGLDGSNPYVEERNVMSVTNATTLTVDAPFTVNYTAAPYVISDPIDIDGSTLLDFFFRTSEKFIATQRTLKNKPNADQAAMQALIVAKENDSRSFAGRVAGEANVFRQRMATMPRGPDIS
jgi:hypothetical protein